MQADEDLIRIAHQPIGMNDRLRQPDRTALAIDLPRHADPSMDAALAAGACGSALSGAGSSILALTFRDPLVLEPSRTRWSLPFAIAHDAELRVLFDTVSCAEHGIRWRDGSL